MNYGLRSIRANLLAPYVHDGDRRDAVTNAALLGNVALLLGFSALGLFFLRPPWQWRALAGFAMGVSASLLS